jgi:PAS domain S-box-containing protein
MAENIDEAFWVTGVHSDEMLYVSPAYEKIWGRSCESLYEKSNSWLEAIHADDRPRVLDSAKSRPAGVGYAETYRILHANGKVRWVHVRSFPILDSTGKTYRTVGIAADITEHRKLEDQFRQAQKMEAIGTLAGGIAHDFNNILGAILGYAELAKTEPVAPLTEKSLDEILLACKRAGDLVKQILAFSRQQEQKRVPLQLWRVVDEAIRLLRAALPSTIQFETDLSSAVPNVLADATQIHQVVLNLCANAAHAMAHRTNGRLGLKIDRFEADEEFVAAHPGGRAGVYTRLTVSDNGHGMERAVLERIFVPFFTTKAPGEGTGLGLAVVHGIMQSHEGLVTVYSRADEGTTFHLYFPAFEGGKIEPALASGKIVRGKGERILVVDDEVHLAHMAGKVLEKLGYEVEVSTDPNAALQVIRNSAKDFNLVLADLTMPGLSGLQLAEAVLRVNPAMPIVLMTGHLTKQTRELIHAAGICDVLMKPITMRQLGETVHRYINH